jgi:hypothetical protein
MASETDAAGNIGTASFTFTLDTAAPIPVIKSEVLSKSGAVTLTGTTAEANDAIAIFDGTTLLGTTTTASNGIWHFTTGKVFNVVHAYTATATEVAGNIGLAAMRRSSAALMPTPSLVHQVTTSSLAMGAMTRTVRRTAILYMRAVPRVTRSVFTWRAARIFLLGDPIS